jgi:hypothetical protein
MDLKSNSNGFKTKNQWFQNAGRLEFKFNLFMTNVIFPLWLTKKAH